MTRYGFSRTTGVFATTVNGGLRPRTAWRIRIPNEYHIPHRTVPITPLGIASEILLLTSRNHIIINNRISNKPTTRPVDPRGSEIEKLEISLVMASTKPRCLRRRKHCRIGPDSGDDRKIFNSTPEILGRISCVPRRSDINAAGNCHVIGDAAEAVDSGVKANLDGCAVRAGFEEECITLLAELVGLLGWEDGIDLGLDGGGGHGGIEDQNVGTKVEGSGIRGQSCSCVCDLRRDRDGCNACSRHCLPSIVIEGCVIVLEQRKSDETIAS